MAKDPAVLFYTSDFLSGTSFFNNEQRGQYIRLLCEQHQLGTIPENHMIYVCGSLDNPVVKKFIKNGNGNYYNERMRLEAERRANFCASRSNNKSGRPKKKIISKSYDISYDNHMENENENRNIIKDAFNIRWDQYPKKDGRKDALRHWGTSVKTEKDIQDFDIALKNYLASERVFNGFIKNGSTFFNGWRDWVDYKEEVCRKCLGKGKYISSTGYESICSCPRGNKDRMRKQ